MPDHERETKIRLMYKNAWASKYSATSTVHLPYKPHKVLTVTYSNYRTSDYVQTQILI